MGVEGPIFRRQKFDFRSQDEITNFVVYGIGILTTFAALGGVIALRGRSLANLIFIPFHGGL